MWVFKQLCVYTNEIDKALNIKTLEKHLNNSTLLVLPHYPKNTPMAILPRVPTI
jgi:hypothetical protein